MRLRGERKKSNVTEVDPAVEVEMPVAEPPEDPSPNEQALEVFNIGEKVSTFEQTRDSVLANCKRIQEISNSSQEEIEVDVGEFESSEAITVKISELKLELKALDPQIDVALGEIKSVGNKIESADENDLRQLDFIFYQEQLAESAKILYKLLAEKSLINKQIYSLEISREKMILEQGGFSSRDELSATRHAKTDQLISLGKGLGKIRNHSERRTLNREIKVLYDLDGSALYPKMVEPDHKSYSVAAGVVSAQRQQVKSRLEAQLAKLQQDIEETGSGAENNLESALEELRQVLSPEEFSRLEKIIGFFLAAEKGDIAYQGYKIVKDTEESFQNAELHTNIDAHSFVDEMSKSRHERESAFRDLSVLEVLKQEKVVEVLGAERIERIYSALYDETLLAYPRGSTPNHDREKAYEMIKQLPLTKALQMRLTMMLEQNNFQEDWKGILADLTPELVAECQASDIQGLPELVGMLQEHGMLCFEGTIENPKRKLFNQTVINDPEVIQRNAKRIDFSAYIIVEDGSEGYNYDDDSLKLSPSQLQVIIPEMNLKVGDRLLSGSDDFHQLNLAMARYYMGNDENLWFALSRDADDDFVRYSGITEDYRQKPITTMRLPAEKYAALLESAGLTPEDVKEEWANNPDNDLFLDKLKESLREKLSSDNYGEGMMAYKFLRSRGLTVDEQRQVLLGKIGSGVINDILLHHDPDSLMLLIEEFDQLPAGQYEIGQNWITVFDGIAARPDAEEHLMMISRICKVEPQKVKYAMRFCQIYSVYSSRMYGQLSPSEILTSLPLDNETWLTAAPQFLQQFRSAEGPQKEFLQDKKVLQYLIEHPEKIDDLLDFSSFDSLSVSDSMYYAISRLPEMMEMSKEKREAYIDVIRQINFSPSAEVERLRSQLIQQVLERDDPVEAFEKIQSVFVKNNLPQVGKIFKVFRILHPSKSSLSQTLMPGGSPRLHQLMQSGRNAEARVVSQMYSDLLRVHIESGNRSLEQYLTAMKSGQSIIDRLGEVGIDGLSESEIPQAQAFLKMVDTLYRNSQLGERQGAEDETLDFSDLEGVYSRLRESLQLQPGQRISDRVGQMFLRPAGYDSIDQVLIAMRESRAAADERNRAAADNPNMLSIVQEGDFVKGVGGEYVPNILQNGSVSKEFLGGGFTESDGTPFDTDLSRVQPANDGRTISQAIGGTMSSASDFDATFLIRDRGQFQIQGEDSASGDSRPEAFNSDSQDPTHWGIRTGFASTEISAIMIGYEFQNKNNLNNLFFEIVQNGYYIPVISDGGNLLLTKQRYDEIKESYRGLDVYGGEPFVFEATTKENAHYPEIQQIMAEKEHDEIELTAVTDEIKTKIFNIFEGNGIPIKDDYDKGLLGTEVIDTGSTGRRTNAPGNYDFDFMLRVDQQDFKKIEKVISEVTEVFSPIESSIYGSSTDGFQQFRGKGCLVGEQRYDIDISFVSKNDVTKYATHDAVRDKLDWVEHHYGEEAKEQIIANVVLAKRVLSTGEAYKKVEHGGFGGAGVENWILQHGGNLPQAFQSFWEASHENGQVLPLSELKNRYHIYDPGYNLKFDDDGGGKPTHDDYIQRLEQKAYDNMLLIIATYLGKS